MPFELPNGWEWVNLGTVCDVFGRIGFRGYTKGDFVSKGEGAISLSPSNIVNNSMNYDNCSYITWQKYEESPEIMIYNGDILLVKTGSSYGKSTIVQNLPEKATINPQFVVLKNSRIITSYLCYFLQSPYCISMYEKFVGGTAIPTFSQANLKAMYVAVPPIQEQSRIVSAIRTAEEQIILIGDNNNELQTDINLLKSKILDLAIRGKLVPQNPDDEPASVLLERIRAEKEELIKQGKIKRDKKESIIFKGEDNSYYEKFADGTVKCIEDEIPFELPQGWLWCRLKDLFNVCSAKRVLQSEWKSEGIPFYRAREIVKLSNDGFVDNNLFISPEHYDRLRKTYGVPQAGDLMVTGVGTIGRVYIVHDDVFYYKDASVLCFENRYGAIDSEFAQIMLGSSFLQEQIHSKTYGNTVDTITISTANNYLCVLPPLSEQTRIIKEINEILALALHIEKSLN